MKAIITKEAQAKIRSGKNFEKVSKEITKITSDEGSISFGIKFKRFLNTIILT